MKEINWKAFELKNPNTTAAFENLCYFLFCRRYKCSEGVKTDFNQERIRINSLFKIRL